MRHLLAGTCLTPVVFFAIAGTAHAERSVTTELKAPLLTSTANNGQPDDIRVTATGSIVLTGGTAITMDSNNDVRNDGKINIQTTGAGTGILAQGGRTGDIFMASSGTIDVVENYTPTDTDKDGDLDGKFAQGSNRFGIRITPGGTFAGNIGSNGKINIEGNNSAGISVESRLQGAMTSAGAVTVLGDNSYGIRAQDVTGNVVVRGEVTAAGQNTVGVAMDGDIGGALTIQGAISTSGYRYVTSPSDSSKLDADDLLQGGSAVRIAGDVTKGIVFAKAPADADEDEDDEDNDGVDDDQEGTAAIATYGSAAAVRIGSATETVTVGAVTGNANGHGLVVEGTITGQGVYAGVNGNGLAIGGLGGDVVIAGGLTIRGGVGASSNGGTATAVHIGDGATVEEIRVSGAIKASGGSDADDRSYAILIEDGASVSEVHNSGVIEAVRGENASAGAIVDRSGGVSLVMNTGSISATGGSAQGTNVAIDLSGNNGGVVVRQGTVGENKTAPSITGEILLGGGNDLLDVDDGVISGTTRFGAGEDRLLMSGDAAYSGTAQFGAGADRLVLEGTSSFAGTADFGGGADRLDIGAGTSFNGALAGSAGLDVAVNGGTFRATNDAPVTLASLSMTGESVLGVSIDGAEGANTLYDVTGAALFGEDTTVQVRLSNISESEGRYVFLEAGSITGASGVGFDAEALPILFKGSIDADEAEDELAVVIERKTAGELNLNGSATRAYDAIFAALDNDEDIANVFLATTDEEALHDQFAQMLPDHAGGVFETVSLASRATGRFLADPGAPIADYGSWGYWLQQVGWGTSKDIGDTAAYDVTGWGASGGAELITGGAGNFGVSLGYALGRDADGDNDNEVRAEQFELAGYWRAQWGGFHAHARVSAAMVSFDSTRNFGALDGEGEAVTRQTEGSWNGQLYSAAGGLSYEVTSGRLSFRPAVMLDYYRLSEDGYTESGGGDGFDLIVDERTSDELAATASVTAGLNFGDMERESFWMRAELEGGRRQIVSGEIGATTARFGDGDAFTLLPENRTDGWTGAVRLMGGSGQTKIGGEFLAEEQSGRASVAFRASLHFGF